MTRFSVMYRGFGTMLRRPRSLVVMVGTAVTVDALDVATQAVERWHHTQHHEQRTVASVPTVEA